MVSSDGSCLIQGVARDLEYREWHVTYWSSKGIHQKKSASIGANGTVAGITLVDQDQTSAITASPVGHKPHGT